MVGTYQEAYWYGRSTEQILLFATDVIAWALNHHKIVSAAFLDLRKVFDSLIMSFCFKGWILWVYMEQNFYGLLVIYVIMFNKLSFRMRFLHGAVKGGIPQLGPLLFVIYVNMMPSIVKHGRLLQFADDTTYFNLLRRQLWWNSAITEPRFTIATKLDWL